MKVIHQSQTRKVKNSAGCMAVEYPLGEKDLNGAVILLDGRDPDKGRVVNKVCQELAYIIKGSGKVVVEEKEVKLKAGDLVYIKPGERFFWEGKMTMFMPCTPAWYPEQYKKVS